MDINDFKGGIGLTWIYRTNRPDMDIATIQGIETNINGKTIISFNFNGVTNRLDSRIFFDVFNRCESKEYIMPTNLKPPPMTRDL